MMQKLIEDPFSDNSIIFLVLANFITIFIGVYQGWSFFIFVLIFWFQSFFMGVFYFAKLLKLENFPRKTFEFHKKQVPRKNTRLFVNFLFALHYSFFHFVYLGVLLAVSYLGRTESFNLGYVLLAIGVFFLSHAYSFFYHKDETEKLENLSVGKAMILPYFRIIPMHIILIVGILAINSRASVIFFLFLKTSADLTMHLVKHN